MQFKDLFYSLPLGKKIFSGYFLLNVVNCKGKKYSEMKNSQEG